MAGNRKIRTFSPYTYNIQYTRPGSGPFQAQRPHVHSALVPEEHMVVSKNKANWYVYATNNIVYSNNGDCEYKFVKCLTTFKIVSRSEAESIKPKSDAIIPIDESGMLYAIIDAASSDDNDIIWDGTKSVQITHNLECNVDFIVIADGIYLNVRKQFINKNSFNVIFHDNFNKISYSSIKIIIYRIGIEPFSTIEESIIEHDIVNKMIMIDNRFMSTNCIVNVFDKQGVSYVVPTVDLMPNRILIDDSLFNIMNKSEIQAECDEITESMQHIEEENALTPKQVLYEMMPEYKELSDRLIVLNNMIMKIGDSNELIDISKIVVHSFNDSRNFIISYHVNSSNVAWHGNYVDITHNLDGYVNFVIDGSTKSNLSYSANMISNNVIRITFDNPEKVVCTIKIFKIGN